MITNKKFTKGEWINLGYRVDVDIADGLSGICVMSDWMPEEQMEANAKLIAAAPYLLELAFDYINYFENSCMDTNKKILDNINKKRIDLYYKSLQAIKKATE